MFELMVEGENWPYLIGMFSVFMFGAFWLNMIKKDRERNKKRQAEKAKEGGWTPTDVFDPSWFEVLLTKCFWWGAIASVFSKTVLDFYAMFYLLVTIVAIIRIAFEGSGWGEDGENY